MLKLRDLDALEGYSMCSLVWHTVQGFQSFLLQPRQ